MNMKIREEDGWDFDNWARDFINEEYGYDYEDFQQRNSKR